MAGAGDPHRPPPPRGTVGSSYLDMEEQTESHEEYISRLLGERPSQPQGDPSGEPSRELNLHYVQVRERCRQERQARERVELQAREAANRARRQRAKDKKKRRQAALALQLEQGPSQPLGDPSGEPQPQQDPSGEPSRELHPLDLQMRDRQIREEMQALEAAHMAHKRAKAKRKAKKKSRQAALALKLEQGPSQPLGDPSSKPQPPQDPSLHRPQLIQSGARVRQSVLYSDRPRQSRRPSQDKLPVKEHAGEVSRREFEALTLGQSIPTPGSTHGLARTTTRVRQSALYSERLRQSHIRQEQVPSPDKSLVEENAGRLSGSNGSTVKDPSKSKEMVLNDTPPKPEITNRSKQSAYDTASSKIGSEVLDEEKPKDESDSDLSSETEEFIKLWKDVPTLYMKGTIYITNGFSDLSRHRRDAHKFSGVSESIGTPTENLTQGKMSTKEIIENGKKWMGEEVMLAFEVYIKLHPNMKDMEYGLDEIQQQCFSVATYNETIHHFNFTVKMKKKNSDDDWSLTPYFAQVMEFCGRKIYTCFKLSPNDDGHCYACRNQGVHALKHPILPTMYMGGGAFTGCPFTYFSDDSDLE